MNHVVKIISHLPCANNTFRILLEKPAGFSFVPGHSIMIAINKTGLLTEKHPLTFTSINTDPFLEFHVRSYPERKSFNNLLAGLQAGDSLVLGEMFGSMRYTGSGLFIAGGIGVAPFLAILRQLDKENAVAGNVLIYSARLSGDLIAEKELRDMLGGRLHITLTGEKVEGYHYGRIDFQFLDVFLPLPLNRYIIGSESFVDDIRAMASQKQNYINT